MAQSVYLRVTRFSQLEHIIYKWHTQYGIMEVFFSFLSAKKSDSDLKKESQEWKERRIYLRMVEQGKLKVLYS